MSDTGELGGTGAELGDFELGGGVALAPPPPPPLAPLPELAVEFVGLTGIYQYELYVRDSSLRRVAQIDDFEELQLALIWNNPSTWLLDIAADAPAVDLFTQSRYGLEVVRDGQTIISGPLLSRHWEWDADKSTLELGGVSDDFWLEARMARSVPLGPPYSSQAFDVRTGPAETVIRGYVDDNLGPSALGYRQVPGLTLASDVGRGSTVTGRARFDKLGDLLRSLALAGGGLGFRIVRTGPGALEFQVLEPTDRSATVRFSPDAENVSDITYDDVAAIENYLVAGGDGSGTSRVYREHGDPTSIEAWGLIESFLDNAGTSVHSELDQAIDAQLLTDAEAVSLTATIYDTAALAFGRDYDLGDVVSIVIGDVIVSQTVQEVDLTVQADGGEYVTATVGGPLAQPPTPAALLGQRNFRTALQKRVSSLERGP